VRVEKNLLTYPTSKHAELTRVYVPPCTSRLVVRRNHLLIPPWVFFSFPDQATRRAGAKAVYDSADLTGWTQLRIEAAIEEDGDHFHLGQPHKHHGLSTRSDIWAD
jgi:hypothetical protein